MIRRFSLLPLVALLLVVMPLAGCSSGGPKSTGADQSLLGSLTGSAAGARWTVPAAWTAGAERPMRVATYAIPASGGAEGGECAVFFFGAGQGGGVDENIQRWIGQFEPGAKSSRSEGTAGGMKLSRVRVDGGYLAPSGPMMQSQGSKPGYRLIGAIVEAPQGMVFFKATGPTKTMEAAQPAFEAMVASVTRE